ncbi:MAG: hypothetical protein DSY90_11380 [Deltaproteobacteria bacterium]|nr:MAG: hypothetical protein DSY90_11380 [Deltaproteobacteria bacterium]RUA00912.1 MAG: hypothetical protein DSY89_05810 [Deltaproteobacteria bacterium]
MTGTPHPHDERCLEFFKKLSEYIDEELDEESCRKIEKHVEDCAPCQACLETLKATTGLCRRLKEKPVPAELSDRLKKMARELAI